MIAIKSLIPYSSTMFLYLLELHKVNNYICRGLHVESVKTIVYDENI